MPNPLPPHGVSRGRSGATRKHARANIVRYLGTLVLAVKVLLVGVLLGGLLTLFVRFDPQAKLEQFTHRPIKEVQIEGTFQFIEREQIRVVIEGYVRESFLELDINYLKAELEQQPWIDTVGIARVWPDKLLVKVVEQQPIARWGEKGFLNMRGDIIEVENTTKIQALPLLYGDDRYAQEIMGQYLRIGKMLAQHDMLLSAMEMDSTSAWTLTLDTGVVLKLGRERLWEKLQYLIAARRGDLGKHFAKVQQVDMRYPSGFAVTWKDVAGNQYVAGG